MKFQGTENYVATQDLKLAVNAAITLKRPLLVKGEPGTGKTMLAEEVSEALGLKLIQWHIKSTTKAQQGLYEYDAVSRLRDSQLGDEKVKNIENYIIKGVLWQAFTSEEPVAILIDEIDKADIEFPNDLLREIDRMEFYCYETRQLIKAKTRPVVFITSKSIKAGSKIELPILSNFGEKITYKTTGTCSVALARATVKKGKCTITATAPAKSNSYKALNKKYSITGK
jgi:MoxR-like ATPase